MRNVIRKRNLVKIFKFGFRKKKRLLTSKEYGWVGASKGFLGSSTAYSSIRPGTLAKIASS